MANHTKAKFNRTLNSHSVAFFVNFILSRDFGGVLTCFAKDEVLRFESSKPSPYWNSFADKLDLFLSNRGKTLELRNTYGADPVMQWARAWLQSCVAGAFGAKTFMDESIGYRTFLMHTTRTLSSAPNYSSICYPKWYAAIRPTDIKDTKTIPAVKTSRLMVKNSTRLNDIGDGFIEWATTQFETIEIHKADLVYIGIADSTRELPEAWVNSLSEKNTETLESLCLHAVRHQNRSALEQLLPKLKITMPDDFVRGFLQRLPEFKYTDTPFDVYDRDIWLKQFKTRAGFDTEAFNETMHQKRQEHVDACLVTLHQTFNCEKDEGLMCA